MNTEPLSSDIHTRLTLTSTELKERGVQGMGFSSAPGVCSLQQRAEDIATALEAYLDGRFRPLEPSVEAAAQEPQGDFYAEPRALLEHTRKTLSAARETHSLSTEALLRLMRGTRPEARPLTYQD